MIENPDSTIDEEIDLMINRYKLDQYAASISPKYKHYLNMEEDLKLLENKIGSSTNILQQNDLRNQYEILKTSIYTFMYTWDDKL